MNQEPFLTVQNVSHVFGEQQKVLTNLSFALPNGGFTALVGPSGVGKSTLVRLLAGLLRPSSGQIQYANGQPPSIGLMFQKDNLMPWRTAYENVRLPLEVQGVANEGVDTVVNKMLNLVGLNGFAQSYPAQLSGGMAQRVALARALVHRPLLLLLDEPFGALDALTRERMGQELLRIWAALPVTVFMVTHSIQEAVLLADEVMVMGGQPAKIAARIQIALPRPRSMEMVGSEQFQQYSRAVRQAIEEEVIGN
ncbi:MAG: ABC transporter ATP-binding protein [Ardenticatenaceae bacterium]|nr:ABC transporter ATP-binding protein [Anaerolineales bacterium]MCB8941354.1 ABC transporter ATP-binding protein [Ardenticatenaceae bacterium]MCB8972710.1 ABC transporter ATP-binding protein [Ardenticatenaceae bacterium]